VLAERLRCSVDSIDRALRELADAGAVRVEERWDVAGDGGRLTNDYYLLEHRDEDPGRTDAPPPGRTDAPPPGHTGAAPPSRTGAAPPAAGARPLREREPWEREPGVNETPPSVPPPGGRGDVTLEVIHLPTAQKIAAAWAAAYRDRASQEPTRRAARQLAREAGRLLADGRPLDVVRKAAVLLVADAAGPQLLESRVDRLLMGGGCGRGAPAASPNPVDARILASVRRAAGEAR
jgi:hypothetical protein